MAAIETIRIKDIPTTATTAAADDYVLLDGATNGTRKGLASNLITATAAASTAAHDADQAANGAAFEFQRRNRYALQATWSGTTETKTGTGSTTVSGAGSYVHVKTGATASSTSIRQAANGAQLFCTFGSSLTSWNGDITQTVSVLISRDSFAADGRFRFGIGKGGTDAAGMWAVKGWGITAKGAALWGFAHDGSTLSELDLGISFAADSYAKLLRIERSTSAVSFFVNGASVGSIDIGSVGSLADYTSYRAETENRTTAGENRWNVSQPVVEVIL